MFGLRSVVAAAVVVAAILLLLGVAAQRQIAHDADTQELASTAGRLQLVLDEQEVGLVRQGAPLAVTFAVANTGTERLWLRQARDEGGGTDVAATIAIEPGLTGEVVAELNADDLVGRGRKHVRFLTSDPTCPELWLTVRGTVIRNETSKNQRTEEPN
jgi:hypothetical protein